MVNKFNLRSWRSRVMKKTEAVKTSPKKPVKKSVYKRTQIKIVKTKLKKKRRKSPLKRNRSIDGNYTIVAPKKKVAVPQNTKTNWIIYSLDGCKFCQQAKDLFDQRKVKYEYIDFESLSEDKKKSILTDIDKVRPGFRTFPRIFSPSAFIGGYSDLSSQSLI